MIVYIEKGIGLHDAIEAAGHWLHLVDGVWVSSNDAVVQEIIDTYEEPLLPLTPARFLYLKALLGVVGVWDELENRLRLSGSPIYPLIYAQRAKTFYTFEKTMELITATEPVWSTIDPELDLSPQTIKIAWLQASTDEV